MVPPEGAPFAFDRSDLRITVFADGRAVGHQRLRLERAAPIRPTVDLDVRPLGVDGNSCGGFACRTAKWRRTLSSNPDRYSTLGPLGIPYQARCRASCAAISDSKSSASRRGVVTRLTRHEESDACPGHGKWQERIEHAYRRAQTAQARGQTPAPPRIDASAPAAVPRRQKKAPTIGGTETSRPAADSAASWSTIVAFLERENSWRTAPQPRSSGARRGSVARHWARTRFEAHPRATIAPTVSAIESSVEIAADRMPRIKRSATQTGTTPDASNAGVAIDVFSRPGGKLQGGKSPDHGYEREDKPETQNPQDHPAHRPEIPQDEQALADLRVPERAKKNQGNDRATKVGRPPQTRPRHAEPFGVIRLQAAKETLRDLQVRTPRSPPPEGQRGTSRSTAPHPSMRPI